MSRGTVLLSLILVCFNALARNEEKEEKAQLIKSGWNIGALPAVTYDSDLGLQYGAFANLYHYGDGSRYPMYNHSFYLELSRYTKGSGVYRFSYDSDQLIRGIQVTTDLSFLTDQIYDFTGFNGYEAVYRQSWTEESDPLYKSRVFYKYDRKLFRWKTDLQGTLGGSRFRWIAGLNFLNFDIGAVDIDKLNKGKKEKDRLPAIDGLYDKYLQWGLISGKEANGGFVPEFKAGLVLDSRDNRPNPMKGVWTEAVIVVCPQILGSESSFSKFSFTHRQYFTLIPDRLSLAQRLAWQSSLAGKAPFYYQPQVITSILKGSSSEGLGGSKTLRGIIRNRIAGDGIFFGNTELRWKAKQFTFRNNNFYIGLNAFADYGKVTKRIPVDLQRVNSAGEPVSAYFDPGAENLHVSCGAGLRAVMNENFVVAFDYGVASDSRDGTSGFYMGLNYLF